MDFLRWKMMNEPNLDDCSCCDGDHSENKLGRTPPVYEHYGVEKGSEKAEKLEKLEADGWCWRFSFPMQGDLYLDFRARVGQQAYVWEHPQSDPHYLDCSVGATFAVGLLERDNTGVEVVPKVKAQESGVFEDE